MSEQQKLTPFDFVNDILTTKSGTMLEEYGDKNYIPFIINRALSLHSDCIIQAATMNENSHISNEMHYAYLMHSIRKKTKVFKKWPKKTPINLNIICIVFDCSPKKALEIIKVLDGDQIKRLKQLENTINAVNSE